MKIFVLETIAALALIDTLNRMIEEAISTHDETVIYRVGEPVRCHEWDDNRWNECSGGIHFFLTQAEAEAYI